MFLRSRGGGGEGAGSGPSGNFVALPAARSVLLGLPPRRPAPRPPPSPTTVSLRSAWASGFQEGPALRLLGLQCSSQTRGGGTQAPHSQEHLQLLACCIFVHSHSKPGIPGAVYYRLHFTEENRGPEWFRDFSAIRCFVSLLCTVPETEPSPLAKNFLLARNGDSPGSHEQGSAGPRAQRGCGL